MRFDMINVGLLHEIDLMLKMAQILLVQGYHKRLRLCLRWLEPNVMIWLVWGYHMRLSLCLRSPRFDMTKWLVWGYHMLKYFLKIVLDSLTDLWMNYDEIWFMNNLILFLNIDLWHDFKITFQTNFGCTWPLLLNCWLLYKLLTSCK